MRKLITITILTLMAMFSLCAEDYLKTREVNNSLEGKATVCLISDDIPDDPTVPETNRKSYSVVWFEKDGSDVVSVYECYSFIDDAFKVWLMNRDRIESIRILTYEAVEEINGTLCLVKIYDLNI